MARIPNISEEKRDRIINCALHEFSMCNYSDASTDAIIRNANISKGSLFYYFESKKGLYLYLIHYCTQLALDSARNRIYADGDTYEIFLSFFYVRIRFCREHTDAVRFLKRVASELCAEIYEEKQHLMNDYLDETEILTYRAIEYLVDRVPLRVSRESAIEGLYTFWCALSMYLIDRYKQNCEPVMSDEDLLMRVTRECFDMFFFGITFKTM